jgi:CDP-diacylglycerol--glycerol-3-phosphate 3-phosphatidyltransferase
MATAYRAIPRLLTWCRIALGPVVILLAAFWPHPVAFAVCLAVAFLSDVFDGVLARRLGIATAGLRRLDSIADSIFYLSALSAVWALYPDVIARNRLPLSVLLLLECSRYAYDWWKFRREASYHTWSSKVWGLALFCGFASILVFGNDSAFVTAAVIVGIIADLEGLLISFALRSWRHDVPTIFHALKVRTD